MNTFHIALLSSLALHGAVAFTPGMDAPKPESPRLLVRMTLPIPEPEKAESKEESKALRSVEVRMTELANEPSVMPSRHSNPSILRSAPSQSPTPNLVSDKAKPLPRKRTNNPGTLVSNKPEPHEFSHSDLHATQYRTPEVVPQTLTEDTPEQLTQRVNYEVKRRLDEFPPQVMAYNGAGKYWTDTYNRCVDHLTANTELGRLFVARTTGKHLSPEGWAKYKPKYTQDQFEHEMEYTRKLIREDKPFVIERTQAYLKKHLAAAEELLGAPVNPLTVDDATIERLMTLADAMEVRKGGSNDILASRGKTAAELLRQVKGLAGANLDEKLFQDESTRLLERAENSFYNAVMNNEAKEHLSEREGACVPFADKARAKFIKEAVELADSIKPPKKG